jgi:hypothetical protein
MARGTMCRILTICVIICLKIQLPVMSPITVPACHPIPSSVRSQVPPCESRPARGWGVPTGSGGRVAEQTWAWLWRDRAAFCHLLGNLKTRCEKPHGGTMGELRNGTESWMCNFYRFCPAAFQTRASVFISLTAHKKDCALSLSTTDTFWIL